MTHEETLKLITRAQSGDERAMEILVEQNVALVKSVVKRFIGRGIDWDDLYQLGCMGLVKAIRGFDMSYDVRFSTYAVPLIMGEVRRFLRDDGQMRVSRTIRDQSRQLLSANEELQSELGRQPSLDEVAARTGMSRDDAVMALAALQPVRSLSEPIGEDGMSIADIIPAGDVESHIEHMDLMRQLERLEPREAMLIRLRYFAQMTQTQIALRMGISQVQVSRMESRILKKLRGMGR